ncbi:MAG: type IV-A pilus assembly ATPase PilB [Gammaproteobacteria bacterium]|jgi:type IV pilus assembly protein PilB|nr:type IV-A pilus assembly ATPase PilB [Gammaproteobacteria bacterium]
MSVQLQNNAIRQKLNNGLPRRLLKMELLDSATLDSICLEIDSSGETLVSHLQKNPAKISAENLALAISYEYGLPMVDLTAFELGQAPVNQVKEALLRKHQAVPLMRRDKQLFVAFADPTREAASNEIAFNANAVVQALVAPANQIEKAMDQAFEQSASMMDDLADEEGLDELSFETDDDQRKRDEQANDALSDDAPVVKFINKVLLDAIRRGASDIHFEPYEDKYRVRLRMDGVLKTVLRPPSGMAPKLSSRLKVMSSLDIAEKRIPQDGRIKLNLGRGAIDFRVSTCPTLFGEKIVLRILDSSVTKIGVESLGFEHDQMELFTHAISKPYGMILVTGPTGSGKTVTLYTGMNMLNDDGRNISTVEDPVEIRVPGINQVQQNVKQGMTFARALRAFLRQDPDVIMVGEIRDLETAEIAIKAAQTGHLVLSTLHTNDAPQSITRLVNMGVPSYNITSALHLVIAQRLSRKLHSCKNQVDIPAEALREFGFTDDEIEAGLQIFEPNGCSQCNEGYKGRAGVFQVMPITEQIERLILEGGSSMDIAKLSIASGYNDLRRSALNKVKFGMTSLMEINRITKD